MGETIVKTDALLEKGCSPESSHLAISVADRLRAMFLNGRLEPGQRIIEAEVAELLETSRGPVREAMRLLEQEGLLRIVPRRGTFVAELSKDDLYDISSLRGVLEGLAARILAEKRDPEINSRLRVFVKKFDRSKDDLLEFAKLDLAFHEQMCQLTGHQSLYRTWCSMRTYIWMFIRASQVLDMPGYQKMVDLHADVVEVIEAGLPAVAEMTVRTHTELASQMLQRLWAKTSSNTEQSALTMLRQTLQRCRPAAGGHEES